MDYQIIHAIEGRIRVRIPLLSSNEERDNQEYQGKLENQIKSLNFVTDVRVNLLAESIVVTYKFKSISLLEMQKNLCQAIEKILPPKPPSQTRPVTVIEITEEKIEERVERKPEEKPEEKLAEKIEKKIAKKLPDVPEESTQELVATETEIIENTSTETSIKSVQESAPELVVYTTEELNLEEDPWEEKTTTVLEDEIKNESINKDSNLPEEAVHESIHNLAQQKTFDNTVLTTSALAKRLQVTTTTLSRYKSKTDFNKWSQAKDPEGIAWNYKKVSKTFYPIRPSSNGSVQPES